MILETETTYALLILLTACLGPRQLCHMQVFASLSSQWRMTASQMQTMRIQL